MLYLMTPYFHKNPSIMRLRETLVSTVGAHLMRMGHPVFSPITQGVRFAGLLDMPHDYDFWKDNCRKMLASASAWALVPMHGWRVSAGVTDEMSIAKERGLPRLDVMLELPEMASIVRACAEAEGLAGIAEAQLDWPAVL